MIYTSCFSLVPFLPKDKNITLISIARNQPKGNNIPCCKYFVPSASTLRKFRNPERILEAVNEYREQLSSLPEETKYNLCVRLSEYNSPDKDLILLSEEQPGEPSHRHILADMFSPLFNIKEYF